MSHGTPMRGLEGLDELLTEQVDPRYADHRPGIRGGAGVAHERGGRDACRPPSAAAMRCDRARHRGRHRTPGARRPAALRGGGHGRAAGRPRRVGVPAHVRHATGPGAGHHRGRPGGDPAPPQEGAEDDLDAGAAAMADEAGIGAAGRRGGHRGERPDAVRDRGAPGGTGAWRSSPSRCRATPTRRSAARRSCPSRSRSAPRCWPGRRDSRPARPRSWC